MKNNRILVILIILVIINNGLIGAKNNPAKYKNSRTGLMFVIPENVTEYDKNTILRDLIINNPEQYYFSVEIIPFPDFRTSAKEKEVYTLLKKEEEVLVKYKHGYINDSLKFFSYKGDIIGQSIFNIGSPEVGFYYEKYLNILKDHHVISIRLFFTDPKDKIVKDFIRFFDYEDGEGYYWKRPEKDFCSDFYKLIANKTKEAPKALVKLETLFDEIIQSITFEKDMVIYYFPTVNKLSFREKPTLKARRIRMLTPADKVEILEKGKTENIGNTKGAWVKVRTESGEVGWCFDAYLEEAK